MTKRFILDKDLVKKLAFISKAFKKLNIGNKSRNFWLVVDNVIYDGYAWESFDVGVNDNGELITCYQCGCSCSSYEFPTEPTDSYELKGKVEVKYNLSFCPEFEKLSELQEITNLLYKILKFGKYKVEDLLKIEDIELRRAVIEYIGLDNFIKRANPKVLDKSRYGKLLKIKLKGDEPIVVVEVKDASSDRKYFLRVPPTMKTAKQAVAWTFGLKEKDYCLEEEA